jgi:hypothetical protein
VPEFYLEHLSEVWQILEGAKKHIDEESNGIVSGRTLNQQLRLH